MNPEMLLHEAARMLQAEASKGPGMMFLMYHEEGLFVTRAPGQAQIKSIVAKYDCQRFLGGLSATQWSALLKKLWSVWKPKPKGGAVGQQPAK